MSVEIWKRTALINKESQPSQSKPLAFCVRGEREGIKVTMELPWGQILGQTLVMILKTTWQLWAFLAAIALLKWLWQIYQNRRLARSGILEIDRMDGKTFEKYLEITFRKMGYQVLRTRYVGDYGADLVAKKGGVTYVIQAKRYRSKVGVKAVQEAVAAKGYYKGDVAMVVTNSFFTKQAETLAKANSVILWDRNKFVDEILAAKNQKAETCAVPESFSPVEETAAAEDIKDVPATCAICGKTVSEKVRQYCEADSQRFGGKIYCYEHQRESRRRSVTEDQG